MNEIDKLIEIKGDHVMVRKQGQARFAVCPDLGARVFVDIAGLCPHRFDFDAISQPTDDFNNYGGGNFWPAPEGGKFGLNYDQDTWVVQEAINRQPFEVVRDSEGRVVMQKLSQLTNRAGTSMRCKMQREFSIAPVYSGISDLGAVESCAYQTVDCFEVMDKITVDQALLASWTLEQFAAKETTTAFCQVADPKNAINFDFYEHPEERVQYKANGFTYRTDGNKAGQIGIKVAANPLLIGFFDTANHLLCIRENLNVGPGVYFNIADNDQPEGPYSAADCYSIFNSDPDMAAFELETIGSAMVIGNILIGSRLVSRTSFAVFEDNQPIQDYIEALLG